MAEVRKSVDVSFMNRELRLQQVVINIESGIASNLAKLTKRPKGILETPRWSDCMAAGW